ncbi:hypothetical protein ACFZAR_40125 [Streptomyces sp. NPDC008222]|uniref:hypothetical protein n=1 Tax=Streptomyces sp. NPDC008222 TaxID=3364820 RepID=UPI0036E79265
MQFATTPAGLTDFLKRLGAGPAGLRAGRVTVRVPARQAGRDRWSCPADHCWAGMTPATRGLHPAHGITVHLDRPRRPTVFVLSVIRSTHRRRAAPLAAVRPAR